MWGNGLLGRVRPNCRLEVWLTQLEAGEVSVFLNNILNKALLSAISKVLARWNAI